MVTEPNTFYDGNQTMLTIARHTHADSKRCFPTLITEHQMYIGLLVLCFPQGGRKSCVHCREGSTITIVKPKQSGTYGRGIRNEHTLKSLICTNIKCYRTNSIYLLSRLYAILLSITKKTARKWKFGIVDDA